MHLLRITTKKEMKKTYRHPELCAVQLDQDYDLCMNGSGTNEDYTEDEFNWGN